MTLCLLPEETFPLISARERSGFVDGNSNAMSVLFFTFANHMGSALMPFALGTGLAAFVATQPLHVTPPMPKITSATLAFGATRLKP
jgi:hypothetical protein